MGKIKILSETLIGKIAAGEVVERPASVLKELIENSIDAGAKSVQIYVKEFGTAQIKVIDDGEGISSEDVVLAFQRHATSKIEKEEDLYSIRTLGFRGEALYSIAQVSKLRIITQSKHEEIGTEIYLIGGKVVEKKPAVTQGTTVEIRELFFNTPVRKKFLKSPFTERAHLIETVQNYALGFPEISFYLNLEGQEVLNIPQAATLRDRLSQVFSSDFVEKLKFLKISKDSYNLELFLSPEEFYRIQRTRQLIFVNRRPVKDASLVNSVYKAFGVREKHPQFILFLTVPPEEVDFNVHPAKREVRFRNFAKVTDLIFKASGRDRSFIIEENASEWISKETFFPTSEQSSFFELQSINNEEEVLKFLCLGEAIVALQQPEGILFIDYHAAHERVVFEKILKKMKDEIIRFAFPQVFNLNSRDYTIIRENLHVLRELQIEAEEFGNNSIIVRSVPEIIKDADIEGIFESIATTLREGLEKPNFDEIKTRIAETIACHKSLRANNRINPVEIRALLWELEKTSDPEHCPHGRPTKRFIPLREIKSWFSR